MDIQKDIAAIEARAFAVRINMTNLCEQSGVHPSTWWRIKNEGRALASTLGRLERKLDELEGAK